MESSSWARLMGALVAPVKTFESIAQKPTWAVALIVLVVGQLLVIGIATPRIDIGQEMRQSIEARGQEVPPEQLDQMIGMAERFRWVGFAFQVVLAPAIYFLLGLVFWLLLRFVGDSDFSYPASMAAVTHAFMPWVVAGLLSLPVVLSRDSLSSKDLQSGLLASHLGALAPEGASAAVRSLLSSVDLFSFWTLALLILGYAAVAGTKRSTVAWVVLGLWALYVGGKVGLSSAFGG